MFSTNNHEKIKQKIHHLYHVVIMYTSTFLKEPSNRKCNIFRWPMRISAPKSFKPSNSRKCHHRRALNDIYSTIPLSQDQKKILNFCTLSTPLKSGRKNGKERLNTVLVLNRQKRLNFQNLHMFIT